MKLQDYVQNKPVLETEQLILRPLRKEDVADLLFQRPKKPAKSFHWGVVHKQDHKVIGDMWMYLIENNRMAKVAFRLSPTYQGNRLMTEALARVTIFCFEETELQRLWADVHAQTLTKQEVGLKTKSSYREIPIPDYVFEAILKERQVYEKNRKRRKREFQDLDYICCSNLGRARSKGFHCRYYKQLLAENGLPDIRWHDLRSTYCTLLLKESFNPKAVSKLMGHAKELITMDVYADNRGIIADGVPEIEEYMKEVLPNPEEIEIFKKELLEIVVDVTEFLPDVG